MKSPHEWIQWDELKGLGFTERFIFNTLEKIEYAVYKIKNKEVKMIPYKLLSHQQQIPDKLGIKLPHRL
ncbi:MAG: hypothetical protein J7K51_07390 [Thermotogae bacterium]|nr:hypothetical protein [Thermotogota bacterium]